jgi:hypothetical protein
MRAVVKWTGYKHCFPWPRITALHMAGSGAHGHCMLGWVVGKVGEAVHQMNRREDDISRCNSVDDGCIPMALRINLYLHIIMVD